MKKITLLSVMAILCLYTTAQSPALKPLSIGDTVPDITLNHIINYKTSTAKFSDFKDKLIILDFWGTWCTACIASFPKMDSLKKIFSSLQVLLVNTKSKLSGDNDQIVQNTFKKLKQRTGYDIALPVVFANDTMDILFPLKYIPHIVWISGNKIIAITSAEEVTDRNIAKALNGTQLNVEMKTDLQSYSPQKLLFENGNGGEPRGILFRSMLTSYIEGLGQVAGYRIKNNKINGVYLINQPLLTIIKNAFRDSIRYTDNRIIIKLANTGTTLKCGQIDKPFCYELMVPPVTEEGIRKYMQEDLKKYLGIRVYNEVRKMRCLVLKKIPKIPPASTRKVLNDKIDLQKDTRKKYIHNRSVAFSIKILNQYAALPILDESGVHENISIDLPFDLKDVKALKTSFKKAGFDPEEEEREIEVTVITDL